MDFVKFGSYRGFRVRGEIDIQAIKGTAKEKYHLDRATYLTAQVESGGKYGTVINYDGTGITACVHQAVALYPREVWEDDGVTEDDQGPLWKVVSRILGATPMPYFSEMLADANWVLRADGRLRKMSGGFPSGKEMRKELSGDVNGVVPERGADKERSKRWVQAFARMFREPLTFGIQDASGEEFVLKRAERVAIGGLGTIRHVIYSDLDAPAIRVGQDVNEEFDLAMTLFWSHAVNAPGMAKKCLESVSIQLSDGSNEWRGIDDPKFPMALVRKLGNCKYGKWDDDLENGRYRRSRRLAMDSMLWTLQLFENDGIFPYNLPG